VYEPLLLTRCQREKGDIYLFIQGKHREMKKGSSEMQKRPESSNVDMDMKGFVANEQHRRRWRESRDKSRKALEMVAAEYQQL
jgi:hypothetical protein